MTTAREKMAQAARKIEAHPEIASQLGATYKFVLAGDGGGTWVFRLKDAPSVSEGDGPADCTVHLAESDFLDLLEGRTQLAALFFKSKLRIEGDISLALKLQALTQFLE